MRIDDVLHYWDSTRGAGHTFISVEGLSSEKAFIYIVLNRSQAISLQKAFPKAKMLTIDDHPESLYRKAQPLVVDHAAMARLIRLEQERLIMMGREMKKP